MVAIGFENFKVKCVIGTEKEERLHPQYLFIDLKVSFTQSSSKDELSSTIDYVQLADRCQQVAKKHGCKLLETLANAIAQDLLENFPIDEVWIKIKKPKAIKNCLYAHVELTKTKVV